MIKQLIDSNAISRQKTYRMVCFVREMAGRAWLIQVSKTFFVNFPPSSVSWGPQLAIDGTTAYYHSRNGASEASGYGDYLQASHFFCRNCCRPHLPECSLQIDLAALYFVTSISYTTRNNCACAEWYNRYVEARVGTVDASQVHTSPALLTVNEVRKTRSHFSLFKTKG